MSEEERDWQSPQIRQISAELARDPATMAEAERIFGVTTLPRMREKPARAEPSRWPSPPDKKVFHGLAGDFVRAVEPYTEGDSVAILVQTLIGFGNALNRRPHFCVESVKHYPNLYAVLMGATSKGRKGTSWGRAQELLSRCDSLWAANLIKGGLSSGEGLIWAVRDPITTHEAVREGRRVIDYQDVESPTTAPALSATETGRCGKGCNERLSGLVANRSPSESRGTNPGTQSRGLSEV
jgi:hypothetical protein